jgi:hypothetical protein
MDPDVMTDPGLRQPVEDALAAVRAVLARVLGEGRGRGELDLPAGPEAIAAALVAVLQGGYVLARAAGSADAYTQAVDGVLALLARGTRTGGQA